MFYYFLTKIRYSSRSVLVQLNLSRSAPFSINTICIFFVVKTSDSVPGVSQFYQLWSDEDRILTRQWSDDRSPLESCRHIRNDQVLSERSHLYSAVLHCKWLDLCSVTVGTHTWVEFRINNETIPKRCRQRKFAIAKLLMQYRLNRLKQQWQITSDRARPTRHRP